MIIRIEIGNCCLAGGFVVWIELFQRTRDPTAGWIGQIVPGLARRDLAQRVEVRNRARPRSTGIVIELLQRVVAVIVDGPVADDPA